jgi:hypothetical protein
MYKDKKTFTNIELFMNITNSLTGAGLAQSV